MHAAAAFNLKMRRTADELPKLGLAHLHAVYTSDSACCRHHQRQWSSVFAASTVWGLAGCRGYTACRCASSASLQWKLCKSSWDLDLRKLSSQPVRRASYTDTIHPRMQQCKVNVHQRMGGAKNDLHCLLHRSTNNRPRKIVSHVTPTTVYRLPVYRPTAFRLASWAWIMHSTVGYDGSVEHTSVERVPRMIRFCRARHRRPLYFLVMAICTQ